MNERGLELREQVRQLRCLTEQAELEAGRLQQTIERIAELARDVRRGRRQLESTG